MRKFVLLIIYFFSIRNPYLYSTVNISIYNLVKAYLWHKAKVCEKYDITNTEFENALISYAAHAIIADVKHFGSYDTSILKVYNSIFNS